MNSAYIIGIVLCVFCFSCNDETDNPFCEYYEEGTVLVGINDGLDSETLFDIVNQYNLTIDQVSADKYESGLPSDSLDYVVNYLNSKDYINNNGFSAVKGGSVYLHYQTNVLTVTCPLWNMTLENQQDWINTKSILKLTDESRSRSLILSVPIGQEIKWATTLNHTENIRYAELNCYLQIILGP